jgi:hypothetical protein
MESESNTWRLSLVRGRPGLPREEFLTHWLGPTESTSRPSTASKQRASSSSNRGHRPARRGTDSG